MHAADQAMYRAERNGKNGIAIERAGEEESAAIVPIAKAKPREGTA
ncbi:hypothetical protein ACFSHP_19530 [Novosphingobium panipatense]